MRDLNPAEICYLIANRELEVEALAKALLTTKEHVQILLNTYASKEAEKTTKKKRGRPKKVATTEQPSLTAEETKQPALPILDAMARVPDRGAIAMSQAASEIGDGIKPIAPKLPDGVFKFKP